MSLLNNFIDSDKEIHQITQNEWVSIMRDHSVNVCGRTLEYFEKCENQEAQCFHRQEIKQALKSNLDVSEEVLHEYPELKQTITRG